MDLRDFKDERPFDSIFFCLMFVKVLFTPVFAVIFPCLEGLPLFSFNLRSSLSTI